MSNHEMGLDLSDLIELGELVQFVHRWLSSSDHDTLARSFARFMGTPAYDLRDLQNDLLRFAFLLGADDDEQFVSGP